MGKSDDLSEFDKGQIVIPQRLRKNISKRHDCAALEDVRVYINFTGSECVKAVFGKMFRSELIAIRRGLQYACETEVQFQDAWILTDSRASIHHLSNWTSIRDQTSLDILHLLDRISSNHRIHFQWVTSPVGIYGNEKADFLAGTAAEEEVNPVGYLTFSELSFLKEIPDCLLALYQRPFKSSLFSPGPEDISTVPLVLIRARLTCPHLDLLGFQKGRGPFGLSSVLRLS
ncbi:RNase H domain-containing protein [Trichonephila clavipes]|nr:RNase H domain-containing protein [Trichonephila clavipes]